MRHQKVKSSVHQADENLLLYQSLSLSHLFLVSRLYVSRSLPSVYEHSKCKHITLTDSLTANKANIICSPINFCYIYSHSRRWAAALVMPFLTNKQGSRSHKNSINKRNIDKEEARPKKKNEGRESVRMWHTEEKERKAKRESFYYFGTATDFAGTKMNLA